MWFDIIEYIAKSKQNTYRVHAYIRSEVPNHRVATHYRAMEEFLPGREKVMGKMCIDMTLSLDVIDME